MKIFPEDVSQVGHHVDELFYLALGLTGVTFLIVVGILLYFIIRYRAGRGHDPHYTHGDSVKALGLTISLALLVFILIDVNLAIQDHHAWEETWGRSPSGDVIRIEVQPQQFAWNIRYPGPDALFRTEDDIVTVNQMHVPVNKPVVVAMMSKDVIHSFFLPNFRIKQDAVPGLVTSMFFTAIKEGTFDIACAEHCGLGHYRMRGELTVESEEEFSNWLVEQGKAKQADTSWGWKWGEVLG